MLTDKALNDLESKINNIAHITTWCPIPLYREDLIKLVKDYRELKARHEEILENAHWDAFELNLLD